MKLNDRETIKVGHPSKADTAETVAMGNVELGDWTNGAYARLSTQGDGWSHLEVSMHPGDGTIVTIAATVPGEGREREIEVGVWDGNKSYKLTPAQLLEAAKAYYAVIPEGITVINLAEAGPEAVHEALAEALGEDA